MIENDKGGGTVAAVSTDGKRDVHAANWLFNAP
jgi:hypothetical protein